MRIAVCVKHVPEGPSRIDPATKRLDRAGEGALNHFDANAVEEALRLKGDSDTEVVAVSLGPQKALDSLRKALAMGADRAVLVSDDAAAGSDLVATSRLLAAALEQQEADLVLFGQQASDADGAVLWAAVAERLGRPVVSQAMELAVDGELRPGQAADGVRLRHDRGAAARRRRGERRDQRAALPVAQGDHGREEEAAGRALARRSRRRRRARRAKPARGRPCSRSASRRHAATHARSKATANAAQAIVDFLAEKRLL